MKLFLAEIKKAKRTTYGEISTKMNMAMPTLYNYLRLARSLDPRVMYRSGQIWYAEKERAHV